MSIRRLPQINSLQRPAGIEWDAPSTALERWADAPRASANGGADISIFDQIGETWDGSGFTPKKMAAILRQIGERPVSVAINSPGGDMFDGIAIYNQLAAHPAEVSVEIIGLAASAASVIAMAGDKISIGAGAFFMIHKCWGVVVGNRHDFTDASALFAPFDDAMAGIYAARTGQKQADIAAMMDAETWISAAQSVEKGFAESVSSAVTAPATDAAAHAASAKARIDALLAKQGVPRSERRALLREIAGTHHAAGPAMPGAGFQDAAAKLLATLQS